MGFVLDHTGLSCSHLRDYYWSVSASRWLRSPVHDVGMGKEAGCLAGISPATMGLTFVQLARFTGLL